MLSRITLVSLATLALVGLSGCGGVQVPVGSAGESITLEDGGDTTTFTDEESGLSVTSGEGAEVSELFPSDFPLPSDAKLVSSAENQGTALLLFEWQGMTKESFLAYVEQAKAAGYTDSTEVSDLDLGEGAFNTVIGLSNGQFDVVVAALGDPAGAGQLSLTSGTASE